MEPLIDNLCNDLKPKRPLWHPSCCMGTWVIAALIVVGMVIVALGLRPDIKQVLGSADFMFEMALMFIVAVSALCATFWLRIPDMRGQGWILPVPSRVFGIYCVWAVIGAIESARMPPMDIHHCMIEGIYITAVPAVLMFLTVTKGCTTRPIMMAVMNGLAMTAIGYIALRLTCMSDDLGHIIFTHLMPFFIIGGVIGLLARRIYKW